LPEPFEQHDAHGCGEVQAPHIRVQHRDFQAVVPVSAQELFRESARFGTKNEAVVLLKRPIRVKPIRFGGEIDEASSLQRLVERFEVSMAREVYVRPVIKSRSAHGPIVHAKACDTDDVQRHVCSSTQASDVAGVGRNLWFYERNRDHEDSISRTWVIGSILIEYKKKRRASLEGLVVSFVRPRRPQMFVCAGG